MNTSESPSEPLTEAYIGLRRGLHRYLTRLVSDPILAEDLLHEVFAKALVSQQRGNRTRHVSGWLFTIARSVVVDHRRKGKPMTELSDNFSLPVEDDASGLELSECLRPLMEGLPRIYRTTLMATEWEGAPLKELAERWNVSVSALKSRASRGRQLLKQRLLDCCKVELSTTGSVLGYERKKHSKVRASEVSCASASVGCSPLAESRIQASPALAQ